MLLTRQTLTLLTSLMVALGLPSQASAATLVGKVVGVSDGDTLTVLSSDYQQVTVRLAQIDAPEKRQDFGQAAKQALAEQVYQQTVNVDYQERDKYGRVVGKVLLNGTDINLEQLKRGMAWVYRQYATDPAYFAAETQAQQAALGLWSQANPIPPWEFRHDKTAQPSHTTPPPPAHSVVTPNSHSTSPATASSFTCGTKRLCRDMQSCDEAKFYLQQCAVKRLDRDGDGTPCEDLCH